MSLEEDRKFFTNFQEETAQVLLAIETYENAIVIGGRGSGKTSFLNHIYNRISKNKKTLVVRFNTLKVEEFNQTNFLVGIFDEITANADRYVSNKVKLKNVLTKMFEPNQKRLQNYKYEIQKDDFYVALDRFLELVDFLKRDGVDICIILDDTDKMDSNEIWNTFRRIRDPLWRLKVPILMAVLPDQIKEITKVPLDHFFPYLIKLKPLDSNTASDLIQKRLRHSNFKVKIHKVIDEIARRADGNPRNVIEMFKHLFEELEIKDAINKDQLKSLGMLYSRRLPDIERAICNYLIRNPETSASSQDFALAIGVTRSRLAQLLNKLKRQGIVGNKKEGRTVKYFLTSQGIEDHEGPASITKEVRLLQESSLPHEGKYLEPEFLSINAGDKVIWKNEDSAAHTITSGNPTEGPDGMFDSSLFMPGGKFEMRFDKKGEYPYFCIVHPWKVGKVIVKDSSVIA